MAKDKAEKCRLGPELSLFTPEGKELPIYEINVEIDWRDQKISQFHLLFELPQDVYEWVSHCKFFNLKANVRGPIFGGGFHQDGPIELETRLDKKYLDCFPESVNDVFDAAAFLMDWPTQEELRATESYYAMYVTQQEPWGPVKTGFKTSWATGI